MGYERSDETAGRLVGRVSDHLTIHSTSDAEFDALLDDGRIVAAREHREYRLRAGIEELECATWIGLLIDLAEHGKQVRLNTTGGETLCGAVDGVGQDVATLRNGSHTVVVSFSAITTADTLDNEPQSPLASDRPARELTLVGILRNLASDRSEVTVVLHGSARCSGILVNCGIDLCSVTERETRRTTYVRLSAIAYVRVAP